MRHQEAKDSSQGSSKATTFTSVSAGKQARWANRLGVASLNHSSSLQAPGVVSSGLVPGPGMRKGGEFCLLGCEGQREEVWLWIG